ncbi:hypothetical protein MIDIC_290020 [Alphaproteobacteria bacterium]
MEQTTKLPMEQIASGLGVGNRVSKTTLMKISFKKALFAGAFLSSALIAMYLRLYHTTYEYSVSFMLFVIFDIVTLWFIVSLLAYGSMLYVHWCPGCKNFWCYHIAYKFILSRCLVTKNIVGVRLHPWAEEYVNEYKCDRCNYTKAKRKCRWSFSKDKVAQ